MVRLTCSQDASLLGVSFSMPLTVDGDNGGLGQPTVTAALPGVLTTRTDANTGVVTADGGSGHGVATSDKVDVYWDGGRRRNMTATVAGAAITLDGGAGDDLPVVNTEVTFKEPQVETHAFDGDDCLGFGVNAPDYPTTVVFQQADGTEIFAVELDGSDSYVWSSESAVTNPLAGVNVGQISYSHGSTEGSSVVSAAYVRS